LSERFGSPGYFRYFRAPAGVIGAALRRQPTTLNTVLVEDMFDDRVRRTIVPTRIVVVIEPDSGDRSFTDIRATSTTAAGKEFIADAKI